MATSSDTGDSRSQWLSNGLLVDLASADVSAPSSIAISDGVISHIVAGTPPPGASNVTDLKRAYILPGLISCHVHLQAQYPFSVRDPQEPAAITVSRASGHARRLLGAGITTIRSVHEQSQADLRVRAALSGEPNAIPRIFGAGRALTAPGGHGDGLGAVVARGEEQFYNAATIELKSGADHLKVFASGGLARRGEDLDQPEVSREEMAAAVRAAAEHATYVTAHAASSTSVILGLLAGVRCFEHGYVLDERAAAELAGRGSYLTPTLVVTHASDWKRSVGFDADAIARASEIAPEHIRSVRRAIAAGVTIVHGTDFPPSAQTGGTSFAVRELELLVEAGLSPVGALRSATLNAVSLLGLADGSGTLRPGAPADLIGVGANPLGSVSALRELKFAMRAGHVVAVSGQQLEQEGGIFKRRLKTPW